MPQILGFGEFSLRPFLVAPHTQVLSFLTTRTPFKTRSSCFSRGQIKKRALRIGAKSFERANIAPLHQLGVQRECLSIHERDKWERHSQISIKNRDRDLKMSSIFKKMRLCNKAISSRQFFPSEFELNFVLRLASQGQCPRDKKILTDPISARPNFCRDHGAVWQPCLRLAVRGEKQHIASSREVFNSA